MEANTLRTRAATSGGRGSCEHAATRSFDFGITRSMKLWMVSWGGFGTRSSELPHPALRADLSPSRGRGNTTRNSYSVRARLDLSRPACIVYLSRTMILVADDNEDNLQIISRILQANGFEVMVERNGKDALERARQARPELIVMDVMMPEMSGMEVLEKLRESPQTSRIPVILLTAMSQNDDVIAGYQIGADYYMTKPYTSKELLYGVRLVLGRNPSAA